MTTIIQKFVLILVLFLSTFTLKSQSLLWIIEGNGLEKPSYLFGTLHTVCKKDFKWDTKLEDVCAYTKRVYFEIDITSITELIRYAKASKVQDENYSLQKLFSENDYNLIQKFFKDSLRMDIADFDNRTPLFLIIRGSGASMKNICKKTRSYETKLAGYYPPSLYFPGKVEGLENSYDREKILSKIPLQRQAEILLNEVRNANKMTESEEKLYNDAVKEYFEMDIEKIRNSNMEKSIYPDLEKVLLDDRNQFWMNKIPTLAAQKSTLFAVGAAHLGGEKGLINLLKQQGFTVRPLSLNLTNF
jgi:uncharacterized protein